MRISPRLTPLGPETRPCVLPVVRALRTPAILTLRCFTDLSRLVLFIDSWPVLQTRSGSCTHFCLRFPSPILHSSSVPRPPRFASHVIKGLPHCTTALCFRGNSPRVPTVWSYCPYDSFFLAGRGREPSPDRGFVRHYLLSHRLMYKVPSL